MTLDWEAHRKHLESTPPAKGLVAMARTISRGSRPIRVRRLGGGLAAATHAVDIQTRSGRVLKLVLKRFSKAETRERHEWDGLKFATQIPVTSPEPVALDSAGKWFGSPAFAMTRIPGRPNVSPRQLESWLEQMAGALVEIHDATRTSLPPSIRRFRRLSEWKPPAGITMTPLVARSIDAIATAMPQAMNSGRIVGHGDFHPGNLLWNRGNLVGVIDWSSVQLSLRSFEVAYCRADLTLLLGVHAADLFRQFYEGAWGQELEDLWVWDLVCGLTALRWGKTWVVAYKELGSETLRPGHVSPRISVLLRKALAVGE